MSSYQKIKESGGDFIMWSRFQSQTSCFLIYFFVSRFSVEFFGSILNNKLFFIIFVDVGFLVNLLCVVPALHQVQNKNAFICIFAQCYIAYWLTSILLFGVNHNVKISIKCYK